MANPSGRLGRQWTNATIKALQDAGFDLAEPREQNGAFDRGDVTGVRGIVIENKGGAKQVNNLPQFIREAEIERDNAGAWLGVAWVKSVGKTSALDGKVVMSGRQFVALLVVLREAGLIEQPPLVCFNHDGIPTGTV